jgi:hypothetical protein
MKRLLGIGTVLLVYGVIWAGTQEDDLLSLARSGIDEGVLISYIDAAKGPYHLTPDQIIQLKDLGVSSKAISEALRHGVGAPAEAAQVPGAGDTAQPPKAPLITAPTPPSVAPTLSTAVTPAAPVAPPPETIAPIAPAQEEGVTIAPPPEEVAPAEPQESPARDSLRSEAVAPTEQSSGAAALSTPPIEGVVPAPGDQNISFFYQALYSYGTWIKVDGQWCWRPNAATVDLNWAPYYTNGYWAYTDWGWFWVSNYSWGWAPFHYGRWYRHPGYGWIWTPGTEWGPAWVNFRSCDGYFGWAPLPPAAVFVDRRGFIFNGRFAVGGFDFGLTFADYRFVPAANFADRDAWLHAVPASQVRGFFGRTMVMRDSYRFGTDHLVNRGPSVELVSHYTGRGIARLTIMPSEQRQGERIHGVVRSNGGLIVYKPMISREIPRTPLDVGKNYEPGHSERGEGARMYDQGGGQAGDNAYSGGNNGQNGAVRQGGRGHRPMQDGEDRDRDRR